MKLKYSELYEKDFLEKFGEYAEEIGELELNLDVPVIDLEKIAEICKLKIETMYSPNISGYYDQEKKIIHVNNKESISRQRFTIAHEIGHAILLHKGKTARSNEAYTTDEQQNEKEANQFAAQLLMPAKMIYKLIKVVAQELFKQETTYSMTDIYKIIEKMAEKFQVSFLAMGIRIEELECFSS